MLLLTVLFPLMGFVSLAFSRGRWKNNLSASIGIGSVGLAFLVTLYMGGVAFSKNGQQPFNMPLWTWISVDNLNIGFSLILDLLSLVMLFVITGVGFLIHIFSSWYMRGEEGYSRFFAYTNLFIASMVVLVLADNFLLMYLGWEGVGLCSYLLIGFYHTDPKNSAAAMKAFVMTRIGDVFLLFSFFILYNELGTLNFSRMLELALTHFEPGSKILLLGMMMLIIGTLAKSAQFPLQTWLGEAMVGPTPVSALIHAATMVTAGVYLIARVHGLFLMVQEILELMAILGSVTMLLAAFTALVQTDIKRVLAYSTMSQIGYMYLALGVQAWDAAVFHLITHAFFKALLFLSAGSVILSCFHEQDIFKMGGLRKSVPLIYVCFLVGGSSLAAFPLITAGFFSKEQILVGIMASGHTYLVIVALVGEFVTALYTFRTIFIVFHGKERIPLTPNKGGISHNLSLTALLLLSSFLGALILPSLQGMLPDTPKLGYDSMSMIRATSSIVPIVGILFAAWLWLGKRTLVTAVSSTALGRLLLTWWYNAWGFDWLYNLLFVKPFLRVALMLKYDPLNRWMNIPAFLSRLTGKCLLYSENGYLRWYLAAISIGAVSVLGLAILSGTLIQNLIFDC